MEPLDRGLRLSDRTPAEVLGAWPSWQRHRSPKPTGYTPYGGSSPSAPAKFDRVGSTFLHFRIFPLYYISAVPVVPKSSVS